MSASVVRRMEKMHRRLTLPEKFAVLLKLKILKHGLREFRQRNHEGMLQDTDNHDGELSQSNTKKRKLDQISIYQSTSKVIQNKLELLMYGFTTATYNRHHIVPNDIHNLIMLWLIEDLASNVLEIHHVTEQKSSFSYLPSLHNNLDPSKSNAKSHQFDIFFSEKFKYSRLISVHHYNFIYIIINPEECKKLSAESYFFRSTNPQKTEKFVSEEANKSRIQTLIIDYLYNDCHQIGFIQHTMKNKNDNFLYKVMEMDEGNNCIIQSNWYLYAVDGLPPPPPIARSIVPLYVKYFRSYIMKYAHSKKGVVVGEWIKSVQNIFSNDETFNKLDYLRFFYYVQHKKGVKHANDEVMTCEDWIKYVRNTWYFGYPYLKICWNLNEKINQIGQDIRYFY